MTSNLGSNTLTTTDNWQTVLKIKCPDFVSWNRISFQIYEGNLAPDGSTLSPVNSVKYKIQASNVDAEALYTDLSSETVLNAGAVTSEEVSQQFIYIRVIAKSASAGLAGVVTVNCAGF